MNTIGNYAPDFEIPGIDKEVYHLGSCRKKFKAIAVVFMGNDSPNVDCKAVIAGSAVKRRSTDDQYIERLNQIQADFSNQGFTLMGINSNYYSEPISQSLEAMRNYAASKNLNFPYLRDPTQDVAKAFKVKVIPTVYLLDSEAVIRYQGTIDDGAESSDHVKQHYLRDNITALLAGNAIRPDYREAIGYELQWRPQ